MTSKFVLFILTITLILGLLSQNIIALQEDDIIGMRERIIIGTDAEPFSAPYIVSITVDGYHKCDGSILTKNTILTAAHCVKEDLYIAAGLHDRRNKTGAQIIKVKNSIKHEKYYGGTTQNDIAVLHLSKPIQFNEHIKPIDIPTATDKPIGEVKLYGWGHAIANSSILPQILQVVTTDIIPNDRCWAELNQLKYNLCETMICTNRDKHIILGCYEDSGGPLVQKHANNKTLLVGIVVWTEVPCGTHPTVYTHIGSYLDWIKRNTRK